MRCKCGYEARDERDLLDHVDVMVSLDDDRDHGYGDNRR